MSSFIKISEYFNLKESFLTCSSVISGLIENFEKSWKASEEVGDTEKDSPKNGTLLLYEG